MALQNSPIGSLLPGDLSPFEIERALRIRLSLPLAGPIFASPHSSSVLEAFLHTRDRYLDAQRNREGDWHPALPQSAGASLLHFLALTDSSPGQRVTLLSEPRDFRELLSLEVAPLDAINTLH